MIELKDFTAFYGDRTLLSGVNAVFRAGRLTALLGRNGTGKSTLLRAMAGLNPYYSGTIEVGNRRLTGLHAGELARTLAFVNTERVRVANLRCRDVVAMGRAPYTDWIGRLRPADSAKVAEALEAVGMEAYAGRTLDTMSDGECQRIMIARALAQATPVILLDEPTSFLDLPNRYELCSLLADLAHSHGKCIVLSTHELDIALALSDDIALIDPPGLHCLPVDAMRGSGYIETLFSNDGFVFDAVAGRIIRK